MMADSEVVRPLRAFLCHASVDKLAVRKLYQRMRADGFEPWLDEEDLLPGQDWQREIPKAVRNSDVVIVCLSRASINKAGYIQKEIKFALDVADEQPEDSIFIIPLKLEECQVPDRLTRWQWVNYFAENGYNKLRKALTARSNSLGLSAGTAQAPGITANSQQPTASAQSNITQQSGGIILEAGEVTVGQDVVGRDKVVQYIANYYQAPSIGTSEPRSENAEPKQSISEISTAGVISTKQLGIASRRNWIRGGLIAVLTIVALVIVAVVIFINGNNAPSISSTQTVATSSPGVGITRTRATDGMVMMYVPGGTFKMGSDIGGDDGRPVHDVTLDNFWIDRTEVTNAQYAKCVAAGKCQEPSDKSSYTRTSYYDDQKFADFPVIDVAWEDARHYCEWAGGRLPTEAQWEYAARSPQSYTYPWGNDPPNDMRLNYNGNVGDTTIPGAYPSGASWVGALDLAGNVWEWVNDWYGPYPDAPQTNPTGSASGVYRVLRGGSCYSSADDVRTSNRFYDTPDLRTAGVGFRCAVAPGE